MVNSDTVGTGSVPGGSAPALRAVENGSKAALGSGQRSCLTPPSSERPRVLVLGGGFAGIGAARKLKDADVDVVLVDRHDYHTFQPLLYQLATGLLETTAVGHSLRDLVKNQDNATIHKAPMTGDRPRGEGGPLRRSRAASPTTTSCSPSGRR